MQTAGGQLTDERADSLAARRPTTDLGGRSARPSSDGIETGEGVNSDSIIDNCIDQRLQYKPVSQYWILA